jgi:hypothetical protein
MLMRRNVLGGAWTGETISAPLIERLVTRQVYCWLARNTMAVLE